MAHRGPDGDLRLGMSWYPGAQARPPSVLTYQQPPRGLNTHLGVVPFRSLRSHRQVALQRLPAKKLCLDLSQCVLIAHDGVPDDSRVGKDFIVIPTRHGLIPEKMDDGKIGLRHELQAVRFLPPTRAAIYTDLPPDRRGDLEVGFRAKLLLDPPHEPFTQARRAVRRFEGIPLVLAQRRRAPDRANVHHAIAHVEEGASVAERRRAS
mmetsp:Transcript_24373/g.54961  ORF Transcript_24373/g.54961 Transcript_24373/m.54961 type:complete len:207 (+) Transcript_24373:181-801(+)